MKAIGKCFLFLILCISPYLYADSRARSATPVSDGFRENHADFFHLFSTERTDMRIGYLQELEANEEVGPGSYELQNVFFDSLFQASFSRDSFFSIGATFDARQYDFSSPRTVRTYQSEENLYKMTIQPGIGFFINDDFLFWAQSELGHYSDLDQGMSSLDNYQAWGNAQIVYRLHPGTQLLAGISYSNDYLDQQLLPFVGIRIMSDTGAFHLAVDLPFMARVGYYLTPKIETFGQIKVSGDRYRTRVNGETFNVGVHDERAGIGLRFWLGNHVSLTFEGGRTLSSELRYYTQRPGQFLNGDIEPHWYVQSYLGLAF